MNIEKWRGKPLVEIGRAGDMLWLGFGEKITVASVCNNEKRDVSEYAIHLQCQWRFVQDGRILVASHDIYEPFELKLLDDGLWEWDVFGREESQSSQFDVLAANLNKTLLPLTVNHFAILDTGDLRIGFDKNVSFETFITYSRKYEFYRLIDFNTDEHYVVFDGE